MDVLETVGAILDVDLVEADLEACRDQLGRLGRVRSWVQSVEIATQRRMDELAREGAPVEPERELTNRGGRSRTEAGRVKERSNTLEQFPQMEEDLAEGAITGAHLDALHRELARLPEPDRSDFVAREGERLARVAARMSPDSFARHVRDCVRQALAARGVQDLEAQKRAVRMKSWTDMASGMGKVFAELDPESWLKLDGRLRARIEQLFHDAEPEGCPSDAIAKQEYLRALAFISLLDDDGLGASAERVDMIVVVGEEVLRTGFVLEGSVVDIGNDSLWLPVETLRRMACMANIIPVVLNSDGVAVDLGHAVRLATKAQRRALRAMYPSCRVPGCRVPFEQCHIHHIEYWENGGPSDLDNMVPLCSKHHHCVHEGGWVLSLDPTTFVLTITRPDGSVETTGPPHARAG